MIKKLTFIAFSTTLLMACNSMSNTSDTIIGGQQDKHGCLSSAGQSWSVLKQQCVQTFNIADIRLTEVIDGTTFSIDIILSDDKQQAEVFAVSIPKNTILQSVKGGYVSDDGKIRLMKTATGWKLNK